MKPYAVALLTVVTFLGGMAVQGFRDRGNGLVDGDPTNPQPRTNSTKVAQRTSSSGPDGERVRVAPGATLSTTAKSVIRIGPQEERLRRFFALLDGVDAGNWEELLRVMTDETSENGRFQSNEWDMALRRIGKIDGARAAAVFAAKGEEDSLRKVLAGWAQTDLEGAWKWVESYKDERGRRDVWRGALIGLAELDPTEAMRKLDSLPFEVKGGTISFLTGPMVQAEGIDATAERIKEIYAAYKAKDPATVSDKEREYVYAYFHNVCDIKRNAGYTPEKRMEALELLAGFPDLAIRSPWLVPKTAASAANDDPQRTMEIVEKLTYVDGRLLKMEGANEVAKIWNAKDPLAYAEWLQKNEGKPFADRLGKLEGLGK